MTFRRCSALVLLLLLVHPEYMAAGVPIVSSDLPSIREVLQHDKNAWLVSPENPESLWQGIVALLKDRDRATRLAKSARKKVAQYTWSKRARGILERIRIAP